jgi:hypothetical protein
MIAGRAGSGSIFRLSWLMNTRSTGSDRAVILPPGWALGLREAPDTSLAIRACMGTRLLRGCRRIVNHCEWVIRGGAEGAVARQVMAMDTSQHGCGHHIRAAYANESLR